MKIAINSCYGGFGLSVEAIYELVKMKSSVIEKFTRKNCVKKNFGDVEEFDNTIKTMIPFKDGYKMNTFGWYLYKDGVIFSSKAREERAHKDVIKVVEKLKGKANGSCAELTIVEIPDGVHYSIDEYDGIESIHENHRSWG